MNQYPNNQIYARGIWIVNPQKCFLFMIFYLMGGNDAIHAFLMTVRQIVHLPGNLDKLAEYGIVSVIALVSLTKLNFKFTVKEILFLLVFMEALIFSWVKQDGYDSMYMSIIGQVMYGLVAYLYFKSIDDFELIRKTFAILALILSISITLQILSIGTMSRLSYSQSLAYALLPAAVISISEAFRCQSAIFIVNSILSTVLIFTMGARWPLVCVGIFFSIKVLDYLRLEKKNKYFLILIIFAFAILIVNMNSFLNGIGDIIARFGLSRRSLLRIQNENFFEGNGRDIIWNYSLNRIKERPLLGYGIGTDRVLISNYMRSSNLALGYYPHNIFIELLFQFGILVGGFLILVLIQTITRAIMQSTKLSNYESKTILDIVLIMILLGLFPLMVSGSYITWIPFYELIGVCFIVNKKANAR